MTHLFSTVTNTLIYDTATIFLAGLIFAWLARRFHQNALIGYLFAGLVIGPHGLRLVPHLDNIRFLADVGVVFLMFALGVQMSVRQLLAVRWTAIVGGLLQILVIILVGIGIGRWAHLPAGAGLVIGYALALNSSVVLVRLLGDYDEFHTLTGRIALGISILLDLMAVVMISTLPLLQPTAATSYAELLVNLIKAVLFIIWTILLARWVAPYILRWASSTGSREILLPTVVVLSVGGAIMSGLFGFSYALGAFLAGLVLSESMYSEAVLAEAIPLSDLFGLLFFVSLGMLVDPTALSHNWGLAGLLLVVAVLLKAAIIYLIILLFRYHPYVALVCGVLLAQIGEFSFILSREAERLGVISPALNSVIIAVAIVSMAITPLLVPAARWAYRRIRRGGWEVEVREEAAEGAVLAPGAMSVLLCGYGRVGRYIGQALDTFRVPFMVVDIDRRAIESLRRRGIRAIYGDAANPRLLEQLGVEQYQLGVIAVAEHDAVYRIAQHLRQLNPAICLLVRSHTDGETRRYLAMGVAKVVHVELEASLSFVQEVLISADVDEEIVHAYLDDIRVGYYEGMSPREEGG